MGGVVRHGAGGSETTPAIDICQYFPCEVSYDNIVYFEGNIGGLQPRIASRCMSFSLARKEKSDIMPFEQFLRLRSSRADDPAKSAELLGDGRPPLKSDVAIQGGQQNLPLTKQLRTPGGHIFHIWWRKSPAGITNSLRDSCPNSKDSMWV